jgi:hypothetical protein
MAGPHQSCTSPGDCKSGETCSCDGECADQSWVGDGFCDDANKNWGKNFDCKNFATDCGGDVTDCGDGGDCRNTGDCRATWSFVGFDWIDAESLGERRSLTDDSYIASQLKFEFPYFGNVYQSVWVVANGYLTFAEQAAGGVGSVPSHGGTARMPSAMPPNNVVAPFWSDLNPEQSGAIYTHSEDDYFVAEWSDIPHYGSSDTAHFEAVLHANGSIVFQYLDVASNPNYWALPSIGIEDIDGTNGLQISYNDPSFPPFRSAVLIPKSVACGYGTQEVYVHIHVENWGDEIRWYLDAGPSFGPYENNNDYYHAVKLQQGIHVMHAVDTYGDGWHGGFWGVSDTDGGVVACPRVIEDGGAATQFSVPAREDLQCVERKAPCAAACREHGSCQLAQPSATPYCQCYAGYIGDVCQETVAGDRGSQATMAITLFISALVLGLVGASVAVLLRWRLQEHHTIALAWPAEQGASANDYATVTMPQYDATLGHTSPIQFHLVVPSTGQALRADMPVGSMMPPPGSQIRIPLPRTTNVRGGASVDVLRSLESYVAAQIDASKHETVCIVCLESFSVGDKLVVLPCQHRYHELCAQQWLDRHTSCPTCRVPVSDLRLALSGMSPIGQRTGGAHNVAGVAGRSAGRGDRSPRRASSAPPFSAAAAATGMPTADGTAPDDVSADTPEAIRRSLEDQLRLQAGHVDVIQRPDGELDGANVERHENPVGGGEFV